MQQHQTSSAYFARPLLGLSAAAAALVAWPAVLAAQPFDPPPQEPALYSDNPADPDAADAIFFVAPWGNAFVTWQTCAEQNPFLSLEQARQQVRSYIAATGGPQRVQVRIAGGVYPMTQPVVFTTGDSGWLGSEIQYVGWELADPEGELSGDDVLFSGGQRITGWSQVLLPGNITAYKAQVPADITEIRDVWVNNFRMIRARFPNVRPPCTGTYANPLDRPCENEGLLMVQNVEGLEDQGGKYQQVTLTVVDNSGPIPLPADWSEVEVVGHHTYVNYHQRVGEGFINPLTGRAVLRFPITQWRTPGVPGGVGHIDEYMDLGAVGPFCWDGWQAQNNPPFTASPYPYAWRFLEVSGVDNVSGGAGGARGEPRQAYLVNSLAFLDADREWYFDRESNTLYLIVCRNPDSDAGGGPLEVIVPVAEQHVVVDGASHLLFNNLSFAYTHQPMPTLRDGVTPGYSTTQAGLQWSDEPSPERFEQNHVIKPAIDIIGASNVRLNRCRIAHTGGSAVAIRTFASVPAVFVESHQCAVTTCEIFDVGGHGVYIGDEHVRRDLAWSHTPSDTAPDPSLGNKMVDTRIHNFGLIYKDSVGIYLGHARKTELIRNEIAWGNWSGMSIGTVRARQWTSTGTACDNANFAQQTEGTSIHNNHIHHVVYRLHDGGGIYFAGSHIPYQHGAEFRWSRLLGNHIHDIVLNPRLNYGPNNVAGFHFDSGSTGWLVVGNYIARAQNMYSFNFRREWTGTQCVRCSPSIYECPQGSPLQNRFWMSAWPVTWEYPCGASMLTFPGMVWNPGNPNYWFDYPGTSAPCNSGTRTCYSGPYWCFDECFGAAGMNAPNAGGGPNSGSVNANVKVTAMTMPVQNIINSAGPYCVGGVCTHGWFFPYSDRRIHRKTFCGENVLDLERQMH